jgi:fibronectin-binding autotransporter adhesin
MWAAPGEFSSGNVTTLLTNLGGANGGTSGGLASGASIGFDTTNAVGSSFTIADNITNSSGTGGGAIGVSKLGSGTLILSGNNSFSGLLKINGTAVLTSSTAWGSGAGGIQLGNNVSAASDSGNLTLATGAPLTGTPNVSTKHNAGASSVVITDTITFDAPSPSTAGYTQNFGVLNLDQSLATGSSLIITQTGNISSQSTANFTSTTLTNNNNSRYWTINATGAAVNLGNVSTSSSVNSAYLTLSGNSTGNSTGNSLSQLTGNVYLTKSGTGTWSITGAGNYTASTTISAGTLSVSFLANGGSNSSIGAATNNSSNLILSGGTLQYTGAAVSTDRLFSVSVSSTIDASGTGAVNFTNTGAMGFNGGTGAKTLTLTGNNTGSNTIAAIIGDNTGATSLTKTGNGTWVLTGNNTYTGTTTVSAGELDLNTSGGQSIAGNLTVSGGTAKLLQASQINSAKNLVVKWRHF